MAPVRSAPNIVKNVRQEFQRLAMYPAAGWLAGTAMGCGLPLNIPVVTLVMAYNLVGASLAYSKGIDDLDRELMKSAMPHIHDALNKRIDLAISRRMPGGGEQAPSVLTKGASSAPRGSAAGDGPARVASTGTRRQITRVFLDVASKTGA